MGAAVTMSPDTFKVRRTARAIGTSLDALPRHHRCPVLDHGPALAVILILTLTIILIAAGTLLAPSPTVCLMKPALTLRSCEALQAAILGVPFVDVVTTERDTAQLLTVAEWDEWGDPLHNASAYKYMLSYSPYDNIRKCVGSGAVCCLSNSVIKHHCSRAIHAFVGTFSSVQHRSEILLSVGWRQTPSSVAAQSSAQENLPMGCCCMTAISCPLSRRAYPHMMVTGSLNDPRVNYWEPAKFVAKMRAVKTDDRMLVLKVRWQG